MSIALMASAWKADLPTFTKMVLLALCDNANDCGECYPSIAHLAGKCSMSERAVFKHIDLLESYGTLRRAQRAGRSTVYHIDPCTMCTPAPRAPLHAVHPTPAPRAPLPLHRVHPYPCTRCTPPLHAVHP